MYPLMGMKTLEIFLLQISVFLLYENIKRDLMIGLGYIQITSLRNLIFFNFITLIYGVYLHRILIICTLQSSLHSH